MSDQGGGIPKFANGIVTESLISRVKGMIFNPAEEWKQVEAEATDSRAIYMKFVAPLAAIGAIASFIGQSLIGYSLPFLGTFRTPIVTGLIFAAVGYALMFASVFVVTLIVDALTPTFGGQKDSLRALKVTAYSYTPAWIAAVFQIIPSLAWIGAIAGLYGIYLLYLGLPVLMRAPKEKAVGYTATVTVAAIVIWLVLGAIGGAIAGAGMGPYGGARILGSNDSSTEEAAGWLSTLFGGKTDEDRRRVADSLNSLAKMGEEAERAKDNDAGGNVVDLNKALADIGRVATGGSNIKPVDFRALKELLPESVAGMERESTTGENNEAMGIRASKATARYSDGEGKSITVEITDMGSLSGLAGWAAQFDPNLDKETDTGYERTTRVNGQLVHEKYDSSNRSGEVEIIAGNRFAVSVNGYNVSMDEMKAVLNDVDYGKLGTLAEAD